LFSKVIDVVWYMAKMTIHFVNPVQGVLLMQLLDDFIKKIKTQFLEGTSD